MPDLVAQGTEPHHRWRRALPEEREVVLGRSARTWEVPWDDRISREHVQLTWNDGRLAVSKLPDAANPIFLNGKVRDQFDLVPGNHFVIGSTTFTLTDVRVNVSLDVPRPVSEQTFSPDYLQQFRFRNADQRIRVLSRLPEIIIGAGNQSELLIRLVNVLVTGIPRATAVAIVSTDQIDLQAQPHVLHWDRRFITDEDFHPSEQLIRKAVGKNESIAYFWSSESADVSKGYTVSTGVDWAFATPVCGEACGGWAIYVAGRVKGTLDVESRVSDPQDLRDELKFTELVASTLGNLMELRRLERRHTKLGQFFSPVVLDALSGADPDTVLAPRETEVSVLFCDLRGFSRKTEQAADDLMGLLERVSQALGVMTRHIFEQGGVVGDFHGDAAMGFWGWPLPQEDSIQRACQTALAIRDEFKAAGRRERDPLTGFHIGLGIATGRVVAGKIGTVDQVKVTVFGPAVNLASRLENMTKTLRGGILLDKRTANYVRQKVSPETARVRRLAVVQPYGMQQVLEVSELLPPVRDYPQLSDEDLVIYERAVQALLDGDWDESFELLHRVPADDRAKDFLTVLIAQHNRTPPNGWDGIISIDSK